MQQHNFQCEICDSSDKTLNIHHGYYLSGLKPWEYPEESLHCLCEDCHKQTQSLLTLIKKSLTDCNILSQVFGYISALEMQSEPFRTIEVLDYEMACGIGDAYGIKPERIINALWECSIDSYTLNKLKSEK